MNFEFSQYFVYPGNTLLADGRCECKHQLTMFFADSRFKGKSKKIKLLVADFERRLFLLVAAAINDFRLVPVYFQFASPEPLFYRFQQTECFLYVLAMNHNIVGIPFKNNFRVPLFNPFIKNHI